MAIITSGALAQSAKTVWPSQSTRAYLPLEYLFSSSQRFAQHGVAILTN